MKHNVGDVIKIKESLDYSIDDRVDEKLFEKVYPVEQFFRGFTVKVSSVYPQWKGYGVKYFGSREFFVHESHIEEV